MLSYLGNLRIRTRLALVTLAPALAFMGFAGQDIWHEYKVKRELAHVTELVDVAGMMGDVLHHLQAERGRSAGYLRSKGKLFGDKINSVRSQVDEKITKALGAIRELDFAYYRSDFKTKMNASIEAFDNLLKVRSDVDARSIAPPEMFSEYTRAINTLINTVLEIEHENKDAEIKRELSTFLSLLNVKERASREQYVGAIGFADGKFTGALYDEFLQHIEAQKVFGSSYRSLASPGDIGKLDRAMSDSASQDVRRLRKIALSSRQTGQTQNVNPVEWYEAKAEMINQLKLLENDLALSFKSMAGKKYAQTWWTFYTVLWLVILAQFLIAAAAYAMLRSIVDPLDDLQESLSDIADGDYANAVKGMDRRDAIGRMAQSLDVLRKSAARNVEIEKSARDQQQALLQQSQASEEQIKRVVDSVAEALGCLARGDLTVRLNDDLGSQYAKLVSDFNSSIGRLQDTVANVVSGAQSISNGSHEMSQASDDLARRTEGQAATLEQTAAAVAEITTNVGKSAEGAKRAQEAVGQSKSNAQTGGEVVGKAVTAMEAIEKSSKEISDIIGVIDEIAFQTNLLALNAGVEAARAGEAGRGFAVVASEVRALAQRSATAARQIKDLISTSTAQVDHGVSLVRESGNALEEIVLSVNEIHGVIEEIAIGAEGQAASLQQVNSAVNQLDQVTQENAAMVEEATAATRTLATQSNDLSTLMAQFKVSRAAGRRSTSAQLASLKKFESAPIRKVSDRVATARIPMVANGNAPVAAAIVGAASADTDWKEF